MILPHASSVSLSWYLTEIQKGSIADLLPILLYNEIEFLYVCKKLNLPFDIKIAELFEPYSTLFFGYCNLHKTFPDHLLKNKLTDPYFIFRYTTEVINKRLPFTEEQLKQDGRYYNEYCHYFKITK